MQIKRWIVFWNDINNFIPCVETTEISILTNGDKYVNKVSADGEIEEGQR